MMIIIVAFLVFWTPIVIYLLMILIVGCIDVKPVDGKFWQLWGHIAHLVMFLQGIINPLIYTCKHKRFKQELRRLTRRPLVQIDHHYRRRRHRDEIMETKRVPLNSISNDD